MRNKHAIILVSLLLLLSLIGCGRFEVDGRFVPAAEATPAADAEPGGAGVVVDSSSPAPASGPDPVSFSPRIGVAELLIILFVATIGLVVVASVIVGAYLINRERRPRSEYPPVDEPPREKKRLRHLFRFRPDVLSLLGALIAWGVLLGLIATLGAASFIIGQSWFNEPWTPELTHPSAILIGNERQRIRLTPDERSCTISLNADGQQQLACAANFEGSLLEIDVVMEQRSATGASWYCSARYGGESVPCNASFSMDDYDTYVVIDSRLGLSDARFRQLVEDPSNSAWGERQWLALRRVLVILLALGALLLLWRRSGRGLPQEPDRLTPVLRAIYAGVVTLLFYGTLNFLSIMLLLALRLVD